MSKKIVANIGEKIEIRNTDEELMGFFYFNPADPDIIRRCHIVSEKLEEIEKNINSEAVDRDVDKINAAIYEQAAFLLGEGAAKTLFRYASPLSVTPDGTLFALYIFDIIFQFIETEVNARSEKVEKAMKKYTEKYSK